VKSSNLILHIETATDVCSVAISEGDRKLSQVESGHERSHARLLNPYIREALRQAGRDFSSLEAVAVSKGPGSYTGLRIGVSTAKGIAYALDIPLLSCGTLENMAHGAVNHPSLTGPLNETGGQLLLCPMLDARRMEVYSCFYTGTLEVHREVAADILTAASYGDLLKKHHIYFFGNGSVKSSQVLTHPHAHFIEGIDPSAVNMIPPVWKRFRNNLFEDVAYFEPYYLKDFVATIPRKKVL
jgi:tRNA threonylcarbamoyladenosine biosynthesis protein TsaB